MSDKSMSFAMKNLATRFENVNVVDRKAAVKFLRDVDIAGSNKQHAFAIYRTKLHVLTGMPKILKECDKAMEGIKSDEHEKEKWEVFAERNRDIQRGALKAHVDVLQLAIGKARTDRNTVKAKITVMDEGKDKVAAEKRVKELKATLKANKKSLKKEGDKYNLIQEKTSWTEAEKTKAQAQAATASGGVAGTHSWDQVLKKLLTKVLKSERGNDDEDSDHEDEDAKKELKRTCTSRLNACSLQDKTALEFAQELKEETEIQSWGLKVLQLDSEKLKIEDRDMNHEAQHRFLAFPVNKRFGIHAKGQRKCKNVMSEIIEHVRNHAAAYKYEEEDLQAVAAVAQTGKKKSLKAVVDTEDDEDDTPTPAQKKQKGKQSAPVVAVVRPSEAEGKMTVHPDRVQRDDQSEVDRLRREMDRMRQDHDAAMQRISQQLEYRGRERERSPRPEYQRRERQVRPRHNNDRDRNYGYNSNSGNSNNSANSSSNSANSSSSNANTSNSNANSSNNTNRSNANSVNNTNRSNGRSYNRGGGQANNVAAVTSDERKRPPKHCSFRPCYSSTCTWAHEPGQSTPNLAKMGVSHELRNRRCCLTQHELGVCALKCSLTHGDSVESAARCPALGENRVCKAFFTPGGCSLSHYGQS